MAVRTMKKGEEATLTVKPLCKFFTQHFGKCLYNTFLYAMKVFTVDILTLFFYCVIDGFGETGEPAHGDKSAVPANAILEIKLELISWRTVFEVTEDKMVVKKIMKEGEGYKRPKDGADVKGKLPLIMALFFCVYCNVFSR
jgi:hypothetical protein